MKIEHVRGITDAYDEAIRKFEEYQAQTARSMRDLKAEANEVPPLFDDDNITPSDGLAPFPPRVIVDMWVDGDAEERAEVDQILRAGRREQEEEQRRGLKRWLTDWLNR